MPRLIFHGGRTVLILMLCVAWASHARSDLLKSGDLVPLEQPQVVGYQVDHRVMIVPVAISDHTYRFLFDTGFTTTTVSKSLFRQLHLAIRDHASMRGSTGKVRNLPVAVLGRMKVGGAQFRDVGVTVADLRASPALRCLGVDGVIGGNLLQLGYWLIDFDQRTVTIGNQAPEAGRRGRTQVPIRLRNMVPHVRLHANGRPVGFTLDTGAMGNFLSYRVKQVPESPFYRVVGRTTYGMYASGGRTELDYVWTDLSGPDGLALGKVASAVSRHSGNRIGFGLLQKYFHSMALDYRHRTIHLVQRAHPDRAVTMYPAGPVPVRGHLVIGATAPDLDGVRPGDHVVAINSVKAGHGNYCQALAAGHAAATRAAPIRMKYLHDGQPRTITLEPKIVGTAASP